MPYSKSLKYAFHIIFRPFDGFWDMKHEKRGSMHAACTLLAAWLFIEALSYRYTGVVVYIINWEYFNVWRSLFTMIVPFLLWCAANWCFTTLMDGKGSLKDIFMASCYALTPFVILNPICIILSNIITSNEADFYYFFTSLAAVWFVFLILAAMIEIHEYSFSKAIFSCFLSLFGMGVMIFLFFIFFALISDAAAYFIALYKEITYRFY